MAARAVTLLVSTSVTTDTVTIDLGSPTNVVAWASITWIDPRTSAFDVNNAIGLDIPFINDNVDTVMVLSGGALGPPFSDSNFRQSVLTAVAQKITFRLRAFPLSNGEVVCVANGIVITNP